MQDRTGADTEGMGSPSAEGFLVLQGVQVVDFGGHRLHDGSDVFGSDKAYFTSVGFVGAHGDIVVPAIESAGSLNDALHENRETNLGSCLVASEQSFFAMVAILLPSEGKFCQIYFGTN